MVTGHESVLLTENPLAPMQAVVLSTADVPVPWVLRVFFAQRLHEFAAAAGHPARDSDDEEENEDEVRPARCSAIALLPRRTQIHPMAVTQPVTAD